VANAVITNLHPHDLAKAGDVTLMARKLWVISVLTMMYHEKIKFADTTDINPLSNGFLANDFCGALRFEQQAFS
jgi:hypothetical protein